MLLRTLDIILFEWEPPLDDGGSPVLGYQVFMKKNSEATYTLVYDGKENPSTRQMVITTYLDQPLELVQYDLKIRAFNWVGESLDTKITFGVVPYIVTSADTSLLQSSIFELNPDGSLTGSATARAAVPATIALQSRDANGVDETTGGRHIFLRLEEECEVTDNYRCDRVNPDYDILNGTQTLRMEDSNDGRYSATIDVKRTGVVSLSVEVAKIGGLYGEYFNNAFLDGVPTKTQVDFNMNFDWDTDLITNEAADFVSIHWYGKLRSPVSEEVTIIIGADDGVRLYLDDSLVVDRWDTCCEDVSFNVNLTKDQFYNILIEYKELQEEARFKMEWVSVSLNRQVIPPTNLYYPIRVTPGIIKLAIGSGPTISSRSTAYGDGLYFSTAGKLSTFNILSRNWDGQPLANPQDRYQIDVTGPLDATTVPIGQGSFNIIAEY
jgi:hypothetical protein